MRRIGSRQHGLLVRRSAGRRGATMIEAALLLMIFTIAVLGMCEIGFAVFRYHTAGEAARQGARLAIVRGELAEPEMTVWGPTEYLQAASTDDEKCNAMRNHMTGLDIPGTFIHMEWLDGNTEVGGRVRVTVTTPYRPMLTAMLGSADWTLSGTSTMYIAH